MIISLTLREEELESIDFYSDLKAAGNKTTSSIVMRFGGDSDLVIMSISGDPEDLVHILMEAVEKIQGEGVLPSRFVFPRMK